MKLPKLKEKCKHTALNEIRLLASVQHQNVVTYRESFIDEASRSVCMIMDLAEDGDMTDKIQKHIKKGTNIPEYELWSILI